MNWRISAFLLIIILMVSCKQQEKPPPENSTVKHIQKSPLVEAEFLKSNLDDSKYTIVDFRKPEQFKKGHIPNAINIWRSDIENPNFPYKGIMASKEQLEKLFSKLGIKNEDTLLIYDDRGLCDAARLWWILNTYNFKKVQLLNGGLQAWQNLGGQLSSTIQTSEQSNFKFPAKNETPHYISKEELSKAIKHKADWTLIDTRTHNEFSGKRQKLGAFKAGRIPNSTFIDWSEVVDYEGTMKFRSLEELEQLYKRLGVSKHDTLVTYCHTGVRSAHTTFVLTQLLAYKNVKNYDGSWVEWSYYNDLPVKKDSSTVILQ
ncbi:sulfurtransferase [Croceitalea sp. MTPC9]|uniref:sulfurtransferase n=1 Tax=unclassified Croceitalea TaxID=2632280 RepID=UPI002B3743C9|nr:sulfurtransferase [Croceitalea sp. MTPC6]GMN16326.1 sulfurtransferase [Croceitalea sp. MTPC9]